MGIVEWDLRQSGGRCWVWGSTGGFGVWGLSLWMPPAPSCNLHLHISNTTLGSLFFHFYVPTGSFLWEKIKLAVAGVKRTKQHQSLQRVPVFLGFVPGCFTFADGLPGHQDPAEIGGELLSWYSEFPEGLGWGVNLKRVSVRAPLHLRKVFTYIYIYFYIKPLYFF